MRRGESDTTTSGVFDDTVSWHKKLENLMYNASYLQI
jgi:hypothetical protein